MAATSTSAREVESSSTLAAWRDRIRALKNVPAVLRILWESGPAVVTWGIAMRVVVATMPFAIGVVAAWILDAVNLVFRHQPLRPHFWWVVGLEAALNIANGLLMRGIDYSDSLLSDRYTHHVSVKVMRHAAQLDLTTYEDPVFYDRLERARVQATDRLAMIQQMGRVLQLTLTTAIWTGYLIWHSPWLALLLALGVLPTFVGETHFAFLNYAKNFRQTPAKRLMDYLRQVAGSREGAKEMKLFSLDRFFAGRFDQLSRHIYEENVAFSRRKLVAGGLLNIVGTLGYYGSYAFIIYRAITGHYSSIGVFYLLTNAVIQASSNLQQVFTTASGIADQALFLTDLVAFFEMRPTVESKLDARPVPRPVRRGFEFRNVSFAYPGSERRVLKDFNFTLHAGERIALIGENGQGKTTIVKLITRLYDPTEGEILLDGVDLREYSLKDLHHEIGVIFQDFMRYEMTARENIAVGALQDFELPEDVPQPMLDVASHKSLAENVIQKLPAGYEQTLGRRFEGGVDLSGGEWQRMALARAYLRDSQLLILDEPTAALDARSEQQVFERFAELTQGKMALLISHRFSTVRMADRIVVLEGGRIVEEGTHATLIAQAGRYATMFEMQAASYR